MQKARKVIFSVQKIFYAYDLHGQEKPYVEGVAYLTNFKDALKEKSKYSQSFVFPFKCRFHLDRREKSSLLRANFH